MTKYHNLLQQRQIKIKGLKIICERVLGWGRREVGVSRVGEKIGMWIAPSLKCW